MEMDGIPWVDGIEWEKKRWLEPIYLVTLTSYEFMAKEWAFHKKEKATMTKEKTIKCGRLWTRDKKVSKGEVSPYQILLRSQVRWDENY